MKSAAETPPDRRGRVRERVQRRGLVWAAAAAIVAIGWIAHPLATGLFLGALMGFALEPLYDVLRRRTGRLQVAALATVSIAVIGILGAVAGFVSLFVTRGVALAGVVATALGPGGALTPWAHSAIELLASLGFSTGNLTDRLRDAATGIASQSATFAAAGFSATASTLLGCFFALLAMHATLLHWSRAAAKLEAVLPLRQEHTRALLAAFRRAGRATLVGTMVTGATQGVLAGVGYWVTGVPGFMTRCPRPTSGSEDLSRSVSDGHKVELIKNFCPSGLRGHHREVPGIVDAGLEPSPLTPEAGRPIMRPERATGRLRFLRSCRKSESW